VVQVSGDGQFIRTAGGDDRCAVATLETQTVDNATAAIEEGFQLGADAIYVIGTCQDETVGRQDFGLDVLEPIALTASPLLVADVAAQARFDQIVFELPEPAEAVGRYCP
jgi:hypothetical protein